MKILKSRREQIIDSIMRATSQAKLAERRGETEAAESYRKQAAAIKKQLEQMDNGQQD